MVEVKVYCDSNVYLDFLLDRRGPTGEPLGKYAKWVFSYARQCCYRIVISDHVIREVRGNLRIDKHKYFYELLDKLGSKLNNVSTTDEDRSYAREIDHFDNFPDALHVALAIRHGADALVTNNNSDFVHYRPYLENIELIRPLSISMLVNDVNP